MRLVLLAAAVLALPLAACDSADHGTSMSITGNAADGNSHGASMDGSTGQVKVDLPGFQGTFKLPKIQMTADSFDMNGVHLYPGSKISGFNVDTRGSGEDGRVRVSFDSPASAQVVRGWFSDRLAKAGFTVRDDGGRLVGTTDEKKPFALTLDDAGAGHATGTITIG